MLEALLLELVFLDDLPVYAVGTRQYYFLFFGNTSLGVTWMLLIDLRGAESFVDASISVRLAVCSFGLAGNVQRYFLPFAVGLLLLYSSLQMVLQLFDLILQLQYLIRIVNFCLFVSP